MPEVGPDHFPVLGMDGPRQDHTGTLGGPVRHEDRLGQGDARPGFKGFTRRRALVLLRQLQVQFNPEQIGHMTCLGRCHENAAFHYKGKNYSGTAINALPETPPGGGASRRRWRWLLDRRIQRLAAVAAVAVFLVVYFQGQGRRKLVAKYANLEVF